MPRRRYQNLALETSKTQRPYYFVRYRTDVITPDGQAIRKQRTEFIGYCHELTLAEASHKRDKVKARVNNLSLGEFHAVPISVFADHWLEQVRDSITAGTAAKYSGHLDSIKQGFGDWPLSELTPYDLETWLKATTKKDGKTPLASATRADIKNVVSAMYSTAQRWCPQAELHNPAADVRLGRAKAVYDRSKLPTQEQFRALVAGLPLIPRILLVTCDLLGVRITEALGLQEKHLDLIEGRVSIEQKWYRGELGDVKTERSRRVLPLVDLTTIYAQLCTGDREAFVFDNGKLLDGTGLELTGKPFDDRDIQKQWRKAAKAADVYWPGHGARTYRRRALTEMQRNGASAIEAMLLAGHSKPDMTAHYTQFLATRADEILRNRKPQ